MVAEKRDLFFAQGFPFFLKLFFGVAAIVNCPISGLLPIFKNFVSMFTDKLSMVAVNSLPLGFCRVIDAANCPGQSFIIKYYVA